MALVDFDQFVASDERVTTNLCKYDQSEHFFS